MTSFRECPGGRHQRQGWKLEDWIADMLRKRGFGVVMRTYVWGFEIDVVGQRRMEREEFPRRLEPWALDYAGQHLERVAKLFEQGAVEDGTGDKHQGVPGEVVARLADADLQFTRVLPLPEGPLAGLDVVQSHQQDLSFRL